MLEIEVELIYVIPKKPFIYLKNSYLSIFLIIDRKLQLLLF